MQVFNFLVVNKWDYPNFHETVLVAGNFGTTFTRDDAGEYGVYRVDFNVWVPSSTPAKTFADWVNFCNAVHGATDPFLFKDLVNEVFYKQTLENAGTGTGSVVDFALDMKYVDAASVLVYKNGVLQGSGYTLINNETTPTIRFSAAPANGVVVTVTYEYYHCVRFTNDPPMGDLKTAGTLFDVPVGVTEIGAADYRV